MGWRSLRRISERANFWKGSGNALIRHRLPSRALPAVLRAGLLLAAVSVYLVAPDDVVWRLVRNAAHARIWEHLCFAAAAAMLACALLLKLLIAARARRGHCGSRTRAVLANLLQAAAIGSLLPAAGFVLLMAGDLCISLFVPVALPAVELVPAQALRWSEVFRANLALGCAFVSMLIFSVVLIDRVADVLFAITALVSLAMTVLAVRPGSPAIPAERSS